jgi:hypothetical protein
MVGQIGPLVQVGRKKTALALHVLGGILGGLAIGIVLGFFGVLLRAAIGDTLDTIFVIVVPLALIYAASVDLGLLPLPALTWVRQTPGDWPCSMGHYPGIFGWGFDLGLGLTTRIPYQTLLVVPLSAFLVGDMAAAIAITTAYGAARALAVVAAVTSANDDFPAVCDAISERVLTLKKLVGATALVIAALIVIS